VLIPRKGAQSELEEGVPTEEGEEEGEVKAGLGLEEDGAGLIGWFPPEGGLRSDIYQVKCWGREWESGKSEEG